MKTVRWRLQRLLDVRQKQEDALRTELVGLTEQAAALRGRILMEKAMLRSRLADLRHIATDQRVRSQKEYMTCESLVDARIAAHQHTLDTLEHKRKEKTEAMLTVRRLRMALERLRTQALNEYVYAMHCQEQKNQDETTGTAFARTMLEVN